MERKRFSSNGPQHARVGTAKTPDRSVAPAKIPDKSEDLGDILDANIIIANAPATH